MTDPPALLESAVVASMQLPDDITASLRTQDAALRIAFLVTNQTLWPILANIRLTH